MESGFFTFTIESIFKTMYNMSIFIYRIKLYTYILWRSHEKIMDSFINYFSNYFFRCNSWNNGDIFPLFTSYFILGGIMNKDSEKTGVVFNIQKYSVHDGPGIRTIVFLKGCPLKCRWCSNPESQHLQPELAYNKERCLGIAKCTHCVKHCPNKGIVENKEYISIDRKQCYNCEMLCAKVCPADSLIVYGKEKTVGNILDTVEQDMAFYARSGGGMTLSGGEPLMQSDFAIALLREAKRRLIR